MKAIQVDELLRFAQAALEAVGVGAENARDDRQYARDDGHVRVFSHGTNNLYNYIRKIQAGGLDAKAVPTVEKEGPSWAIVNGNAAMGMVSSCRAMNPCHRKGKEDRHRLCRRTQQLPFRRGGLLCQSRPRSRDCSASP